MNSRGQEPPLLLWILSRCPLSGCLIAVNVYLSSIFRVPGTCWAHCKPDFVSLPYRLFRQLPWLIISILQWGNRGLMNLSKPAQGHTVLWPQRWPSDLYEELMALTKDRGLRFVLVTLLMQSWGRNRNPELRIPNLNAPMNPREILLKCESDSAGEILHF